MQSLAFKFHEDIEDKKCKRLLLKDLVIDVFKEEYDDKES